MNRHMARKRPYGNFKVGDVFIGVSANNREAFVLVAFKGTRFDVLDLVTGEIRYDHLDEVFPVPPGYDVYRGHQVIART